MNLFDNITQSNLNDVIDLLLNNYHREVKLNIDDNSNDYCSLTFDLSEGVDAGDEVIFNEGDELHISITDKRLAEMGYTLRFHYYLLNKGDYTGNKSYDDLQSFDVKLEEDTVSIPFTDNQVYLQKNFELILLKDIGYRLLLNTSSTVIDYGEEIVLTADYTLGSVPVENASVEFYNGETLIDTVDTDEDGLAVLTLSDLQIGSYNFNCICDGVYSSNVSVVVVSDTVMELEITGDSFESNAVYNNPFTYTGRVFVDWGDDTGLIEYVGGRLTHTYASNDNYTIKIYGEIISLDRYCFRNCTGLTSITIPSSVTSLGELCFNHCTGLTSIIIPNSVTSLGELCFTNCTGLTSIIIPNSVTSLGYVCFSDCTYLTSINIPNSVINIGDVCFKGCLRLNSINLNWTSSDNIIEYNSRWILQNPNTLKFSIPNGTTSLYIDKGYPSDKLVERT